MISLKQLQIKMKLLHFFLIIFLSFSCISVQAQLLDALKKRADEKGLETREISYDTTSYDESKDFSDYEGLVINKAQDFYNKDVIMTSYDKDGRLVQTSFFDSETVAMRTENPIIYKPVYHDSIGKFYAFNQEMNTYETMSILPASSMGFMTAGMTTQAYRIPQEPYFEAFEALSQIDVALNFLILEFTFIYKPIHFETDDNFSLQSVPCFPNVCKRFYYNDPEYQGSYIQFDNEDRLVEFYINSTNPQLSDDKNPSGKFVYTYEECTVELPDATERSLVPGPLGKIIPLEKGLEPWKHNKKDKQ